MKTSELTGQALDWAVAKCEGGYPVGVCYIVPKFSTDWAQGGAIIEGECIDIRFGGDEPWEASMDAQTVIASGPTPLIAAMRCYVASKLGETVDMPEELLK